MTLTKHSGNAKLTANAFSSLVSYRRSEATTTLADNTTHVSFGTKGRLPRDERGLELGSRA